MVVTARPSWARVKSLVLNFAEINGAESIKVTLAGSSISRNFGDISNQIPPSINFSCLPTLQESDDLTSIALSAFNLSSFLARSWVDIRPDAVLVIADRTETLGVAAAAAICQIPLIHLQGGELSGSIDNKIRNANSKLADLHLTTNLETRQRLIDMGEPKDIIKIVGCPSLDLVKSVIEKKESCRVYNTPGVGVDINNGDKFGIVMFHPDTFQDPENLQWLNTIVNFVEHSALKWLWFWPNPDHGTIKISKELRRLRESTRLKNVRFVINLEPEVFISLSLNAEMIIGNSSFGIREASFIGLPAINLGKRQKNRQKGRNVLDIENLSDTKLMNEIFSSNYRGAMGADNTYGDGNAGKTSANIIASWVPILKN